MPRRRGLRPHLLAAMLRLRRNLALGPQLNATTLGSFMNASDGENQTLALDSVPDDDAPWLSIARFARTFNAYEFHGSTATVAEIANQRRHGTLIDLRTCLFFEQRRWNHFGSEPDDEAFAY